MPPTTPQIVHAPDARTEPAPRAPPPVWAACGLAVAIAAYDVLDTFLSPGVRGRIGGTLLRDALLVLGAVIVLRRERWVWWLLLFLFALSLVRVISASEVLDLVVNLLAVPALALLFLRPTRDWVAKGPRAA